jgi:signal transduction histidine kinase
MRLRQQIGAIDVGIALVVTAAMEIEVWTDGLHPAGAAAVAFAVLGGSLVLWRAAPLLALVIGLIAIAAAVAAGVSMQTPVSPLLFYVLVLYSVGLREELAAAVAGLVLAIGMTLATNALATRNGEGFAWSDIPWITFISVTPWIVGRAMRGRVRHSEELERRAERLERERLAAVAEERARIARELHDVIAHSVTVMVVQAGAAEEVLKRDPGRALEPLRSVQETGRQALVEMTRLVGLLRDDAEEVGLAPQPGLDEVPALVAQVREAGLPVELRVEGDERRLPPALELTAYRVVQEALTNALKHAGDTRAEVSLRYGADALELEVVDDGPGSADGFSGGHGLAGVRERVTVFDGEFAAGPRPDGGFAVRARLPLATEPA